jgi:hypothetical protein
VSVQIQNANMLIGDVNNYLLKKQGGRGPAQNSGNGKQQLRESLLMQLEIVD